MTRLLPDDGPQKARIFPNAVDAPTYLQAGDDLCPTDLEAIPHPRSGPRSTPLKLHEYLAVGQPVVATDLETVRPFSSVLAIARSPQEWLEAISAALCSGGVGTKPERQAVALANAWECRIDQLVRWIEEVKKSRGDQV